MVKNKVMSDLRKIQLKCMDTSGIETEEATKMSLVLPVISALGYDIFNTDEVKPECGATVGIKKGDKIDYAIYQNGQPIILIEAKQVGTPLKGKVEQLFRYFAALTAKVAILTDGVKYLFYTDSKKENLMDTEPYMTIDMSKATDEELERFITYHKETFNVGDVLGNIKFDQFNEVSRTLIESLLGMRPANWIIRKLAEDCQIDEPDDAKLAEIFNNQLKSKLGGKKAKAVSKPKKINGDVEEIREREEGVACITDEIFKDTKGIKVSNVVINGESILSENVSWKELYRYVFCKCTEEYASEDIYNLFNKDNSRKYIYKEDSNDDIKKKSLYMEDKGLYLYQHLGGRDLVYRCIEACDIFGVINKETIEIHYEI